MAFLPFGLSYLVLTPRRIRLPGDVVTPPNREHASFPSFNCWSMILTHSVRRMNTEPVHQL
ncbi:hypothetical protein BDZ94DRAFT_1260084 [Collybia nuda]|uniref:Uncharacterized protein n=1 Tax=Collybia nuda TaxID=64659 RepID=A0A9P5Y714_9AGAR|nr:hypothetical protein BDZ94DRAFT_1260084 [Collybia nuda]